MKVTFELPGSIYREVKARSALGGRPVREAVIEALETWLRESPASSRVQESAPVPRWEHWRPPARAYLRKKVTDHSMEAIRRSIAEGRDDSA